MASHHITLDYAFGSFADGAPVSVTAAVDGVPVVTSRVFQWAGNAGTLAMEIGNLATGTLIDNFSVSTLGVFEPDSDVDGLPDSWEMTKAGNLTDLTGSLSGPGPGAGTGNFDADTLTDLQEYQNFATYPDLNPKVADSDADGLEDGLEVNGSAPRPPSNPTSADSDGDGLSDAIETNSGTFVNAGNPGTSPVNADTDGDQFPDGYEIQRGSNPTAGRISSHHPADRLRLWHRHRRSQHRHQHQRNVHPQNQRRRDRHHQRRRSRCADRG